MSVNFTNNTGTILRTLEGNKKRALRAMGTEAAGLVKKQMESGYARPVRDTGALMGSITHQEEENATIIGTDKKYALFVHDGHMTRGGGSLGNKLMSVVNAVFAVLAILGVVNDPTTAGLEDSRRAMGYDTPYPHE